MKVSVRFQQIAYNELVGTAYVDITEAIIREKMFLNLKKTL